MGPSSTDPGGVGNLRVGSSPRDGLRPSSCRRSVMTVTAAPLASSTRQLAVPDIHGKHALGASVKQNASESARCAKIKAGSACDGDAERVERDFELGFTA
jgi:hypothetical protein